MDGILGFAMKAASETGYQTVIENLYANNLINKKMFSVQLHHLNDQSKLIIGEPDEQYYTGSIIYSDVIQPKSTGEGMLFFLCRLAQLCSDSDKYW